MSTINIRLECQTDELAQNLVKILGVTGLGRTMRFMGLPVVIQNMKSTFDMADRFYTLGSIEPIVVDKAALNLDLEFYEVPEGTQGGLRFDLETKDILSRK